MRLLGGEAPGSRAPGARALHAALLALITILISAFLLYATAAWAQTADEAEGAESAGAAQSETQSDPEVDPSAADDAATADEDSEEEAGSGNEASKKGDDKKLAGKPAEDEDSERVMKTPEEAAEDEAGGETEGEASDELAEKIAEAESIGTLATGGLAGEVAFAQDRDGDGEADRILIPRGDCVVRQGASVTLREDAQYGGARFTLTDNRNVQISSNNRRVQIVSDSRNNNDVRSDNGRVLDPGAYDVVSSRGIFCADRDGPRNPPNFNPNPKVGIIYIIERTSALPNTGGDEGGGPLTTAANGERASTPASVLFSVLGIVGFTGLLFLRRRGAS